MFYRENGQFKTSYRADQQIFPIAQDRWAILAIIAFAAIGVPLLADEYLFRAIFIPFLILSLAAIGVNILVGYCGQISLGSGAFMAVGAYMAYNTYVRIEGMPLIVALRALPVIILGGLTSVPGAIIGGLIIGVGEKLSEVYLGPYVGGGIEIWFAYMLALVFLLFRPQGLFGEKIIDRV